jgi:hypothetical protein
MIEHSEPGRVLSNTFISRRFCRKETVSTMTVSTNAVSAGDGYDTVAVILQTRSMRSGKSSPNAQFAGREDERFRKSNFQVILEILFSDRTTAHLLTVNKNSQPVNVNKKLSHSLSLTVP